MLSPLEIAAGVPLARGHAPVPVAETAISPRGALERGVLPALRRAPSVVSFSGGCDSSLVLAAAVEAARRHGLPLPVPLTIRVRGDADSDERVWQELVIRELRLDDWVRLEVGEELDCIGPIAQGVLRRHGVLWPANVHFHIPQLERAAGGSLLTGIGGDQVFSRSGWERLRRVLGRAARPEPRDVLRIAAALAPLALRARVAAGRADLELDWLRPAVRRRVVAALARETASEPVAWRRRFEWVLGLRYIRLGVESLRLLGADHDVSVHHPLLDETFVASLAGLPRELRFEDRPAALASLFGDLLPPAVATRRTKAVFSAPLWGPASRSFVEVWDGTGVDLDLVDVDALRRRWQVEGRAGPHTLLQSLWLNTERDVSPRASSAAARQSPAAPATTSDAAAPTPAAR